MLLKDIITTLMEKIKRKNIVLKVMVKQHTNLTTICMKFGGIVASFVPLP